MSHRPLWEGEIPLHRSLAWKCSLNTVMEKVIKKMMGPKKINIKEVGNCGNGQVYHPDVETVDIYGYDSPQGFVPYRDEEDITT